MFQDNAWERISDRWSGSEFVELLNIEKIGCHRFPEFFAASSAIIRDFETMNDILRSGKPMVKPMPTITHETKKVLEYLCFVMEKITSDMFVNDYRAYIVETTEVARKTVSPYI